MRFFSSVRARATAGATLLFAAALAVAAVGLVIVLERTMVDNVDTALRLRAADIGALLEDGTQLDEVAIVDEEDSFVQVIANGAVVASSENIEGQGSITDAPPGTIATAESHPVGDSAFRVLVAPASTPSGSMTVIVGNTLEDVEGTIQVTLTTLAVGMPLLVLLAAAMTWVVVGRALRPVESIRAEVAEIGATDLDRRVPEPRTDDEIGRLADTMNEMLDRIESGTLRQRRFVSDASHELRTPIATIRHELEVALQHRQSADWPMVASDVLEEDLRMQRLVDDLLWLARHDQDGGHHPAALVDLDEIALHVARRQATPEGVVIDASGIGAGQVRGDADDLTRVVQNLLDNAVRHAASSVAVVVGGDGAGRVHLHVDDDGSGVPVDMRPAVFERFTRSDEARDRDQGGAGLGLAIAAEIAAEHGGVLSVTDSRLGGARFTLELADTRTA